LIVWRICARRHAGQAFSGRGAREYGGRWNHPGVALVYTAGTLSLGALELFVNLDPDDAPGDLVAIGAAIPERIRLLHVRESELSGGWRAYPAPSVLQDIGSAWVTSGATAVLAVPSAIIPQEANYLLNPAHEDFSQIKIERPEAFQFDPRMWRKRRGAKRG
jgi:RES domain-containing protein